MDPSSKVVVTVSDTTAGSAETPGVESGSLTRIGPPQEKLWRGIDQLV